MEMENNVENCMTFVANYQELDIVINLELGPTKILEVCNILRKGIEVEHVLLKIQTYYSYHEKLLPNVLIELGQALSINSSVTSLTMKGLCVFEDNLMEKILMKGNNIEKLNVTNNKYENVEMRHLINCTNLKKLNLNHNKSGLYGPSRLTRCIQNIPALKAFYINGSGFCDLENKIIAEELSKHHSLTKICLGANGITPTAAKVFGAA